MEKLIYEQKSGGGKKMTYESPKEEHCHQRKKPKQRPSCGSVSVLLRDEKGVQSG